MIENNIYCKHLCLLYEYFLNFSMICRYMSLVTLEPLGQHEKQNSGNCLASALPTGHRFHLGVAVHLALIEHSGLPVPSLDRPSLEVVRLC